MQKSPPKDRRSAKMNKAAAKKVAAKTKTNTKKKPSTPTATKRETSKVVLAEAPSKKQSTLSHQATPLLRTSASFRDHVPKVLVYTGKGKPKRKRTNFSKILNGDRRVELSGHRLNHEHLRDGFLPWATITVEWTDKLGNYEWNHEECAQTMLQTSPEDFDNYMTGNYPDEEFDKLGIWKRIKLGEDVLGRCPEREKLHLQSLGK